METKTNTFAADEVKRLELRVAAADVEIKEAASREIRVDAEHTEEGQYCTDQSVQSSNSAHYLVYSVGNVLCKHCA